MIGTIADKTNIHIIGISPFIWDLTLKKLPCNINTAPIHFKAVLLCTQFVYMMLGAPARITRISGASANTLMFRKFQCIVRNLLWSFSSSLYQWFPKLGPGPPRGSQETERGGPQDAFQKTFLRKITYNCIFNPILYKFWLFSFLNYFKIILWLLGCCSFVLHWCPCRSNTAFAWLYTMLYATARVSGVSRLQHRYYGVADWKVWEPLQYIIDIT